MNTEVVLKVENISKQYRLGQVGTGTISHDLNRWWHKIRGKDDPYLKIGSVNDRTAKGDSDYVWALQDINFEVRRGEVLGVIGKNGAGKSTLLKILSKVTAPTTGSIKFNGRIASLLEVGTGFHPELTGRENIYLNGAILGMTKKEIGLKIEEIIDFSGCQRYVDTPVKRYSSGMTVRLAFAVAAFLEPEILIIDEVLAVGDADFQKKALGKMQDIARGEGRTVLFVSHNMAAVKNLCTKGLVLENGLVRYYGSVDQALNVYSQNLTVNGNNIKFNSDTRRSGNKNMQFLSVSLSNQDGIFAERFSIGDTINIKFEVENLSDEQKSEFALQIFDSNEMPVFHIMPRDSNFTILHTDKIETYEVCLKDIRLFPGFYNLNLVSTNTTGHEIFDLIPNAITFEIIDGGNYTNRNLPRAVGLFFMNPDWTKKEF